MGRHGYAGVEQEPELPGGTLGDLIQALRYHREVGELSEVARAVGLRHGALRVAAYLRRISGLVHPQLHCAGHGGPLPDPGSGTDRRGLGKCHTSRHSDCRDYQTENDLDAAAWRAAHALDRLLDPQRGAAGDRAGPAPQRRGPAMGGDCLLAAVRRVHPAASAGSIPVPRNGSGDTLYMNIISNQSFQVTHRPLADTILFPLTLTRPVR